MKVLIVDDEKDAQDVLKSLLGRSPYQIEAIATASNVLEAVQEIKKFEPDLVFLDVEMPEIKGYRIVEFFAQIDFHIVFVTAYDKYAIKTFEINAIDYLLKPVDRERLHNVVENV